MFHPLLQVVCDVEGKQQCVHDQRVRDHVQRNICQEAVLGGSSPVASAGVTSSTSSVRSRRKTGGVREPKGAVSQSLELLETVK